MDLSNHKAAEGSHPESSESNFVDGIHTSKNQTPYPNFPAPSKLRNAIENYLEVPVVFQNQIESWSIPLSTSYLTEKYGSTVLDFRLVPKCYKGISWETQHTLEKATISDFISWQNEESNALNSSNSFKNYKKDEFWAYSGYNHIRFTFPKDSDIQTLKWDAFGYPEVTGKESTFWIGSKGANTPCHFDTYGCNIVAQIAGRKQWILFPPTDTSFLYPTRIPYEESSVFSSVNVSNTDFTRHPLFKNAHPHIVTLEPGDVLFVPKQWWHFVSCLDDITISINTWIKLDSDSQSRLEESVVKSLMSSLISYYEPDGECWLNPKEELALSDEATQYINTSLQEVRENAEKERSKNSQIVKKRKISWDEERLTSKDYLVWEILHFYEYIVEIKKSTFQDYLMKTNQQLSMDSSATQEITLNKVINSFVHPNVVSLICSLLKRE